MSRRTRKGTSTARAVVSSWPSKKQERKFFCGECLREIGGHWLATKHLDDETPICKARAVPKSNGLEIVFQVDTETLCAIESSGLDPRNSEYWERHPASDGNKGYRTWRGKRHELVD